MSRAARLTLGSLPFVIAVLIAAAAAPDDVKDSLAPLVRNLASGLFVTAGALRLAAWRLTRDWTTARSAIALLAIGIALPSTAALGLFVHDGDVVELEAPQTRLLFLLPMLVLVFAGARHNPRLLRRTLALIAAVGLAVPLLIGAIADATPAGEHQVTLWVATESAAAAVWAALALHAWAGRRFSAQNMSHWVTVGLCLMSFAEMLKAWSVADAHAPRGLSGYLQLIAALIAVSVATNTLCTAVRTEAADTGELTRALVDTQRRLALVEQAQRRRLHDARSAVLGVVGASRLLAEPEPVGSLDPSVLHELVTQELERLQGLLDGEDTEPAVEFELSDALGAVVLARHLDGLVVDLDWRGVRALGYPRATATVLDNLLRNTHRHAPGARALVTARTVGSRVEIVVSDDGPGIPSDERDGVLRAGVRGSRARGAGSGFGLYSAARAMTAQGGSLRIGSAPSGGTRVVLRMPAASARHAMAS